MAAAQAYLRLRCFGRLLAYMPGRRCAQHDIAADAGVIRASMMRRT